MVWGAIGKGWRSPLVIIKGTLNAEGYIDLLNENKIIDALNEKYGERKFYFQQDGASPHRAKVSVTWIEDRANLINDWPANSPDLSCIENLWGILKARVAMRDPQSIPDLESFLIDEWNKLDQETIDALIASTPMRFEMAVQEERKSIGHLLHKIRRENEAPHNPSTDCGEMITISVVLPNQTRVTQQFSVYEEGEEVFEWVAFSADHPSTDFALIRHFHEPLDRKKQLCHQGLMPNRRVLYVMSVSTGTDRHDDNE